ncbi:hypothetical protein CVIRNUC_000849 [Coccomyxa viridis]|uniref:Putative auto-transporter adhesin head GIN domain-containing protein n=1 Tax=Coccomyxa viridis TaxID=1274662 RepID=A0AAV1HT29_9CHLO|nr:hypothetical protein CVIRNUC_000849 [Coccomyxa viridis]
MQRLHLCTLAVVALASAGLVAGQTTSNTTYFTYFESLSVCAPVSVLVNQSADGKYSITVDADAAANKALVISYQGGKGLGIESLGDFNSSNPIKITLSLPPGVFNYAELDYTNSDLVIDNTFSKDKGEIANNGDGTVIVNKGMDGSLNKVSIVGSGDLVMRGKGTYSELFSDGSGNRYLSGLQGQINIKHDGSGSVNVQPGTGYTNIGGVDTGTGSVSYTQGNCTVRKDPDAGPAMVGNACTQVGSMSVPPQTIRWTCGIAVKGDYACGGGGLGGPPSVTKIPCSAPQNSLTMFTLNTQTE